MSAGWEARADQWLAWARTPGFDAYWSYRDAFFELVPAPDGGTLEVGCGEGHDTKLLGALTFENIAATAVAAGLANAGDLDELMHEFHAFAARPHTMLTLPRMVQVWGRVPAH